MAHSTAVPEVRFAVSKGKGATAFVLSGEQTAVASGALVIGGNRDSERVAFETAIVSFFVEAADMLGVPKSVAAIYGICFASAEPLSFADIDERLDISKGSISQGLRVLREVGALRMAAPPPISGSSLSDKGQSSDVRSLPSVADVKRRDYYEPDLKLRRLAAHWIEQRLQSQLNSGRARLQGIARSVPGGKNGANKLLKDRLKTLQAWHDQTRALLPMIKTFLKL